MSERAKLKSSAPTGLAGAGGGTLLVLLANNLPQNSPWKPWLVLIAPSVSVGIAVLFSWARRFIDRKLADRELERLVRRSRETLETALRNPETSPEHKAEMRKALEGLEKLLVQRNIKQIDAIDSAVIN
jgi:hypothetical protein